MTLPRVIHPTKKIHIPSLNIDADFEPFTTQDEKSIILLERDATLYDKSKIQQDILQKCCKTEGIDFSKLSTIEITYLFLKLRAVSVGGTLDFTVTCPECGKELPISLPIDAVTIDFTNVKPLTFTINTDDGPYIVTCSHIRVEDLKNINTTEPGIEDLAVVLRTMMKPDGNDIIELTPEEKIELFNQLDTTIAERISDYIKDAPTLEYHLDIDCPECGHKFGGELQDFFI